jgi:hypothetical protein
VYEFLEVDPNFKPSMLGKRVNKAGRRHNKKEKLKKRVYQYSAPIRYALPSALRGKLKEMLYNGHSPGRVKTEYEKGMKKEVREHLQDIYKPHNEKLAEHLSRDLSFWT